MDVSAYQNLNYAGTRDGYKLYLFDFFLNANIKHTIFKVELTDRPHVKKLPILSLFSGYWRVTNNQAKSLINFDQNSIDVPQTTFV